MIWHDIADPKDPELDRIAAQYNIHPLQIEDCRHRNQRAKVEENSGYIFTVLKLIEHQDDGDFAFPDLDVFLGEDWVITVRESIQSSATRILEPIHAAEANLRADQVFYRICDGVVDSYLPVIDHIDDFIDDLEDQVLQNPAPEVLSRIFDGKRTLIYLRPCSTQFGSSRDAKGPAHGNHGRVSIERG